MIPKQKRKFECSYCGSCFGSNERLRAHMKLQHGITSLDRFEVEHDKTKQKSA